MADDCEVGGISVEEARQAVVSYFQTNYSLSYDVFYPGDSEPDLESRDAAFILLGIDGVNKEQAGMGMREFITDKFLDVSFWIRDDAGMKEISVFEDFVDGISVTTSGSVVYGTPIALSEKSFKGWSVNTVLLPFKF